MTLDGKLIINGKRVETPHKKDSLNPATLEPVGKISLASSRDCHSAVRVAKEAFPGWKILPVSARQKIFRNAKEILLQKDEEAARLITVEKGSPYPESYSSEVFASLGALDYYARKLKRLLRPHPVKHTVSLFLNKKSSFRFDPLGPTMIISPWNFPFLIAMYDVLSALSAGNTVILRPSSSTPFTGLMVGEILTEAGLPPGVLNIINCKIPQAEEMICHPDIQSVMFTGSVSTGKRIMELASRNLTNLALELGGKDPMVVCTDADVERAAQGAVWAGFMNCGQSCGSIERVYVAKEIAEEFTQRVVDFVKKIKVGNPIDPGIEMGPMATLSQLKTVKEHIRDAQEKGAKILYGGKNNTGLPGYFINPTVLSEVDHTMKIMTEETFGPTLPIMTFSDPEEAISLANDSSLGLTASVWTRSKKRASWMAERIETGTITINDHMFSFIEPAAIWGGIKQTGMGRSHGPFGLQELVNIKFVSFDFLKKKKQLWWFPYDSGLMPLLKKSAILFHHSLIRKRLKALLSLTPFLKRIKEGSSLINFIKSVSHYFRK
ncbi:MAG: aldehyde dehydrogenase family protein [Candidatus Aminicenantes bacterium]|nr:MAG: aldehyde dehydrogenase family protein [Candidatus Aminicenantes bacterium]